jgi:hypothetical protein
MERISSEELIDLQADRKRLEWFIFSEATILRDGDNIAIITNGDEPITFLPWREAIDRKIVEEEAYRAQVKS